MARILVDAPSSINAEELWARAGGSSSRLSRATAYRVLNLFTQLGITESSTSLTGGQVFRLRRPLPSLYLVCAQQGVIEELDDPQIAQALATLARRNGCRLHGAIELRVTRLAGD